MPSQPDLPDPFASAEPPKNKSMFGPRTADPSVPPPARPTSQPPARPASLPPDGDELPWWKRPRARVVALVVGAFLPAFYLLLTSASFRATGLGGFLGVALSTLSLLSLAARFALQRDRPRALGLSALAALAGGLALTVAGVLAHSLRAEADSISASNMVHEPGMREFLIAEAHGNGRSCALFGLLGLPGALLGGLSLALVLGARRALAGRPEAKDAPDANEVPVWLALAGTAAFTVVGFVASVWAAVLTVEEVKNPREARLTAIADAASRGDLKNACDELEVVLAPAFVDKDLLEQKLPGRVELSHRCITLRIDQLPLGRACDAASDKLRDSETVKLAKAEERVKQACKGR